MDITEPQRRTALQKIGKGELLYTDRARYGGTLTMTVKRPSYGFNLMYAAYTIGMGGKVLQRVLCATVDDQGRAKGFASVTDYEQGEKSLKNVGQ